MTAHQGRLGGNQALAAKLRRALAVNVGTAAGALSRAAGVGGGTTVGGAIAERIDPRLLADFAHQLARGVIAVSGTNGKTTTARMLADSLRMDGYQPVANREGSNLTRGLVGAFLRWSDRVGKPQFTERSIGVLEVDEGALARVVPAIAPKVVVLTNLFRDQLDRYFELDFLRDLWGRALRELPPDAILVVNGDDPQLAYLAEMLRRGVPTLRTVTFGVEDRRGARPALEHSADARRCPRCQHPLVYEVSFYAHLGHYACSSCGWHRPRPDVAARRVDSGPDESALEVERPGARPLCVQVPLWGLHNAYNVLAALAAGWALELDDEAVRGAASSLRAAFGRAERLVVDGRDVLIALAKNPTGFDATLRSLGAAHRLRYVLLALNDAGPDGRDVSWIWDIDFEGIDPKPEWVVCSGRRAHDIALRADYAGMNVVCVLPDPVDALGWAVEHVPRGGWLSVIPTYTAMWSLREALVRRGELPPFWAAGTSEAQGEAKKVGARPRPRRSGRALVRSKAEATCS